jgi:hypothetical protein
MFDPCKGCPSAVPTMRTESGEIIQAMCIHPMCKKRQEAVNDHDSHDLPQDNRIS